MSTKQDLYRAGILEVRKAEFPAPGRAFGVWIIPLKKWAWQGVKKDVAENAVYYFGQGDGQDLLLAAIGGHQETAIQVAEMIQKGQVPPRPRKAVAPRATKQTEDWIDVPLSDLPSMRVPVKKRIGDFVVHHTVIPEYTNAPAHVDDELWSVSYKTGHTVSHHATYLKRLRDAVGVAEKLAGEWNETFRKAMDGDAASMRQILDNIKKQLGIRDAIREYNRNPTCCGGAETPVLRNPVWADRVLNTQGDEARKYAAKHNLPSPIPRVEPDVRGRQKWLEFGCGTYGCVYPTGNPGIVVKVTHDADEVALAKLLMKLGDKAPAGIVRYFGAFNTDMSQGGADVHLLWREEALEIGYRGPMAGELAKLQEFASLARAAMERGLERHDVAGRVKHAGGILAKMGMLLPGCADCVDVMVGDRMTDVRNVAHVASDVAKDMGLGNVAPTKFDAYAFIAAAGWMAAELVAKKLAASKDLRLVGEAFLEMSGKGMLMADVRDENLGRVERGWVIIDPGYSYSAGKTKLVPELGPGPKLNPVRKVGSREYVVASLNGGERYEHTVERRFGKLVTVKQGHFHFLLHETGLQLGKPWRTLDYVTSKARFYNKDPKGIETLARALIAYGSGQKDRWLEDVAADTSYDSWAWGQRIDKASRRRGGN